MAAKSGQFFTFFVTKGIIFKPEKMHFFVQNGDVEDAPSFESVIITK